MAKITSQALAPETETRSSSSDGIDVERARSLLVEMAAALEACLECDGLDFTAEHDGEAALRKYRALVK